MKIAIRLRLVVLVIAASVFSMLSYSQDILNNSQISGSFQADATYYLEDTGLDITDSTLDGKLIRMNGFTEVNYSYKNFSAGMRFEAYLPPLLGYDAQYEGLGVPYWYASFKNDLLEITAGTFYEQFGNGMVFRTYQDWSLGYDNSLKGLRVKLTPVKGITLTGVYGVQRNYWIAFKDNNRGIVKGGDADFYLNDIFSGMENSRLKLTLGGSFVSDYQRGKSMDMVIDTAIYTLKLPENVASWGGRVNMNIGGFNLYSEYAYKINDPSDLNNHIYKNGNAWLVSGSYSMKNLGITAKTKWLDNMSYKSDRTRVTNGLDINYLPPITKEHTYYLPSMYPYATQPTGEAGFGAEVIYTIPKKSKLGGKYGMTIDLNFSQVNSIHKQSLNDSTQIGQPGTFGYKTSFFSIGDEVYFQDVNVEITKKFNKTWKGIFGYYYITYNKDVIEGHVEEYGTVFSNIGVADITWNITSKYSLRGELQGLWTGQDKGDWVAGLLEFTISPKWFISVSDQWNYGNNDPDKRLHYYNVNAAFVYNTTRIALSYGRQREGIICVGGVCRYVPQSNGLTLTITSSF
jgi:hypothetical protein